MKKNLVALAVPVLAAALALPLAAQSVRLNVNVPFQFTVGHKTLPAGAYVVEEGSSPNVVLIESVEGTANALSIASRYDYPGTSPATPNELVFHRYGDKYFLSRIDSADVGYKLPASRSEKAMGEHASLSPFEIVTVLAQR